MNPRNQAISLLVAAFQFYATVNTDGRITFKGGGFSPLFSERHKAKKAALFSVQRTITDIRNEVGLDICHIDRWQQVEDHIRSYNTEETTISNDEVNAALKTPRIIKEVVEVAKEISDSFSENTDSPFEPNPDWKLESECPFKKCPNPELCKERCEGIQGLGHSCLHVPNRFA